MKTAREGVHAQGWVKSLFLPLGDGNYLDIYIHWTALPDHPDHNESATGNECNQTTHLATSCPTSGGSWCDSRVGEAVDVSRCIWCNQTRPHSPTLGKNMKKKKKKLPEL